MTFVATLFSLKWSVVCLDLRDYIGLCFLCSCKACGFFNVKCGTISKLFPIHSGTPVIQIWVVRTSLKVCRFFSDLTLARPASCRVLVFYRVKIVILHTHLFGTSPGREFRIIYRLI